MKKKNTLMYYTVAILLIGFFILYQDMKPKHASNMDDLYNQLVEDCMHSRAGGDYILDFDPADFDFEAVIRKVSEKDYYKSTNIGAYNWHYMWQGNKVKFHMNIEYNANAWQLVLADLRIKSLCKQMEGLSDYEKIKAVHDYLITYCDYGYGGLISHDVEQGPFWALYTGKATCNGYAMVFYRAMEFCNIPVSYETGDYHAWNGVKLDGKWYNIDLTWDDPGYGIVSYDYFLKCDSDFYGHHHGCSDANQSVEIVGRTAEENYKMFFNFKIVYYLFWILLVVSLFLIATCIKDIRNKRYLQRMEALKNEFEHAKVEALQSDEFI